jgi:hypothetical protein
MRAVIIKHGLILVEFSPLYSIDRLYQYFPPGVRTNLKNSYDFIRRDCRKKYPTGLTTHHPEVGEQLNDELRTEL